MPRINIFMATGAVVGAGVGATAGMLLSCATRRRAKQAVAQPETAPTEAALSSQPELPPKPPPKPPTDSPSGSPSGSKTPSKTPSKTAPQSVSKSPPAETVAAPKKGKHDIYGIGTHYLTSNSEFYTPLTRFHDFLQFKEEREAFADLVVAIDGILGMEILLNARTPMTAAQIPTVAQRARNMARLALKAIIDFSQEQRPSATKQSTMKSVGTSILTVIDEIITGMYRTIAAEPITERS